MIYKIFKNIAFKLDAELAHNLTLKTFHHFPLLSEIFYKKSPYDLSVKVGNLNWVFPVGLAAGLDKNATCLRFFDSVGFGAVEVGTVTPRPQVGNNRPRLFRYPKEESIRNRMGFNNYGSDFLEERVQEYSSPKVPLGINIGKNKTTANSESYKDYTFLYEKFKNYGGYIVINVSSPNTPGLRENQTKDALEEILKHLNHDPLLTDLYVKIAPDIDKNSVDDVIELAKKYKLAGLICTNTTIIPERGEGGVSGRLLYKKSKEIRDYALSKVKDDNLEVIGVGGFSDYEELVEFWKNGGKVIQIYSSFVFKGPNLLQDIQKLIENDLKEKGFNRLESLIKYYREL